MSSAKKALATLVRAAAAVGVLLAAWQWLLVPHTSPGFVASPGRTWTEISGMFSDGQLWSMLGVTCGEAALGFAVGMAAGVVVALVISVTPVLVGRVVEPIVVGLYAAQIFVLAPLLFVLFGAGLVSRAAMVFIGVFPVVVIYGVTGIRTADPNITQALVLYGASPRQIAVKFYLPQMFSYLETAVVWLLPAALTVAIGSEIFFGSLTGLGGVLEQGTLIFDAAQVFGPLVVATVLGVLLLGLTRLVARRRGGESGPMRQI